MRVVVLIVALMVSTVSGSSAIEFKWMGKKKTGEAKQAKRFYNDARGAYGSADYTKAIDLASKAIKADPKFDKAYALRGKARKDMGDLDNAIKDLDQALALNPKLGEAFFVRAQVNEIMGEMDKAAADYKKSCNAGYKSACQ